MTIQDILRTSAQRLAETLHNRDQAWAETEILLAHALGRERSWILAHGETTVAPARKRAFDALLKSRVKHKPMAYLLGHATFYGRKFATDKRALIPRQETEELATIVLEHIRRDPEHTLVLDVGTGSGAIAVSLKAECPKTKVFATELHPEALRLARINARRILGSFQKIRFAQADLIPRDLRLRIQKNLRSPMRRIVITANLPYLPNSDFKKMPPDVALHEPKQALFGGRKGDEIIRDFLQNHLRRLLDACDIPWSAFLEIDPPQAKTLSQFAKKIFPRARISVLKDSCERDRILEIEDKKIITASAHANARSRHTRGHPS